MQDGKATSSSSTEEKGSEASEALRADFQTRASEQDLAALLRILSDTQLLAGWKTVWATPGVHNCWVTVTFRPPARSTPTQEPNS